MSMAYPVELKKNDEGQHEIICWETNNWAHCAHAVDKQEDSIPPETKMPLLQSLAE